MPGHRSSRAGLSAFGDSFEWAAYVPTPVGDHEYRLRLNAVTISKGTTKFAPVMVNPFFRGGVNDHRHGVEITHALFSLSSACYEALREKTRADGDEEKQIEIGHTASPRFRWVTDGPVFWKIMTARFS